MELIQKIHLHVCVQAPLFECAICVIWFVLHEGTPAEINKKNVPHHAGTFLFMLNIFINQLDL